MEESHIVAQEQMYVRYDQQGNTKLIKEDQIQNKKGFSYRKVHYTEQNKRSILAKITGEVFSDPQWKVTQDDVKNIDIKRGPCVLKRLIKLYPKNKRPSFFPKQSSNMANIKNPSQVPNFLTEINLFPMKHYKSLFLTQDFQEQGLYHILINVQGRWQTDVVDDLIPVYAKDQQPVWDMDLNNPWQLILLKFWAKRLGGYSNVLKSKPWTFIECFTNSNWKYFNLSRQPYEFLIKYTNKVQNGKFVLKTKSSVQEFGLISDSCGYQLVGLVDTTLDKKDLKDKKWILTIRSTLKNKWAGGMSIMDSRLNTIYDSKKCPIRLERDFVMGQDDFLNIFSSVHIASIRDEKDSFNNYYRLAISPKQTHAVYLTFQVNNPDAFLDFTIVQFDKNKKQVETEKSRIDHAEFKKQTGQINTVSNIKGPVERYLKIKYSLVLDNRGTNESKYKYRVEGDKKFPIPQYEVYEIEYAKGYNRGDAHFVNLQSGNYILKIKKEKDNRAGDFVINYSSNVNFSMKETKFNKEDTALICKQSMVSLINQQPRACLQKQTKNDEIAFANLFEAIGYGFIGVRSSKNNTYNIMLQIDPKKLREEGYKLKNNFKNVNQVFGVVVGPGQSTSILFKKIDEHSTSMVWPPKSIGIFKQKGNSFK